MPHHEVARAAVARQEAGAGELEVRTDLSMLRGLTAQELSLAVAATA